MLGLDWHTQTESRAHTHTHTHTHTLEFTHERHLQPRVISEHRASTKPNRLLRSENRSIRFKVASWEGSHMPEDAEPMEMSSRTHSRTLQRSHGEFAVDALFSPNCTNFDHNC